MVQVNRFLATLNLIYLVAWRKRKMLLANFKVKLMEKCITINMIQ